MEARFVHRLSLLTCVVLTAFSAGCGPKNSAAGGAMAGMPPAPVRAVAAVESDVPLDISAIGNVEAISTVDVKARVAGQILRVLFQDGQDVRQGQQLFEIDPEPLLRQITELKADVARDVALERQSNANITKDEATVKQARAQADRGLALAKDGIYSKEQTEQVVSTSDSAQASLEADRAAVESAQASLAADRAKLAETNLQLGYTKVVAPIGGRAGVINAKQGTLVKDNDTVLVTLLQVSPIYVSFGLPEQLLPEVRKFNGEHSLAVNAATSDGISQQGQLRFIDSSVDTTTGTIKLKAQFENQRRALWPGQFVNVNARLNVEHDRIVIPSMTVQTGPQGKYVWVMDPASSTVAMRNIQVVRSYTGTAGEQAVIGSGLRSGEMVVSEGQMRLMPGGKVYVLKPNTETGRATRLLRAPLQREIRGAPTMAFTDLFIRRAVTTCLVMVGILGFGILSYTSLPVSALPSVEYPTINISAALPGANPDTMASSVATPLEKEFSTIAGINSMSSSSALGSTSITLQFDLSRNIDAAAQDVQAAIARAGGSLPTNMPAPPSYSKVNPAEQPILYMGCKSKTIAPAQLDEYAETLLARRISMVSGVARVQVYGSKQYAVRVQADPQKLAARQVDLEEVRTALGTGSLNLPAGALYGTTKSYTVQSNSQLNNADQFRPLIVAYRNGNPVRLGELGDVLDSVSSTRSVFWLNGEPSMVLAVQKQPGSNTVAVVDAIKALLPGLRQSIPAGIQITADFDASTNIRDSIADVKFTLMITIGLVVLVIFFFLRNVSATVIPSLAVPLSLLGTFAVMKLLGFTIDMLSMMAVTLSVGFVVDDAIVMLENIVRHMEMGKPRLRAAIDGAREVGFTIVSMTVSLVAVFIPVLFLGGIIGRLLREFSVTIAAAVLISGFISLTLTPMLCSRWLRHESHPQGRFYRWSEKFFVALNNGYRRTLEVALRYSPITLTVSIVLTAVTIYMFIVMPKGFMPTVDTGFAFGGTEAAEDTSFEQMVKLQRQVIDVISSNPWVASTGAGTGNFTEQNQGFMFVNFKDDPKRPPAAAILGQIQMQLMNIPGVMAFMQVPPLISLGQNEGRSQYSVALQDADTKLLYQWAPKMEAKLHTIPQLRDIFSDLRLRSPRLSVVIDRDRALALGVTPDAVANTLYSAYGNRRVSTITSATNQYDVILEVLPKYQRDPASLSELYLRSTAGKMVPLSAVTTIRQTVAPLSVNHIGQLPAVNFQFNLAPGVALSEATKVIDQAAHEINLPSTMSFRYQGTAEAFQTSLRGLTILLFIAVLVIYLVLGILYESFIHPITILSGLPSAGLGALITLLIFHQDLNLYSFVGIILLIGIVKKNAIMMIDFALEAQRKHGKPPREAIFEGCVQRFRPIMMTTMAALLGTLPIAIGAGPGGEARRPLGIAVVGGLIVSQVLTLYITPVIYLYLDRLQNRGVRRPMQTEIVDVWQEAEAAHR